MRSRSVSITGATGFVGWHLAEAFRLAGWRVRAIVRPGGVEAGAGRCRARRSRACTPRRLSAAIGESDVVVHAAGLTRALDASAFEFNVSGTRAVVGAANATGARLVLISSQAAMGAGTVSAPDAGRRCAAAADRRTVEASWPAKPSCAPMPGAVDHLRPTSVYGPRDRQFLPLFRLAARGMFLQVVPAATAFTFIYVDDLARGVVLAAEGERASGQTLFLGHPDPVTCRRSAARASPTCSAGDTAHGTCLTSCCGPSRGVASWRGHSADEPLMDRARLTELGAEGFVCAVDRAREVLGTFSSQAVTALPSRGGLARTWRSGIEIAAEIGWV